MHTSMRFAVAHTRPAQVRVHHWREIDLQFRPQAPRWLLDFEVDCLYTDALRFCFRAIYRPN